MGKLIDVIVDTVSNPTNFWIQPIDRFNEMIDLVEEMTEFYSEDIKSLPPVKSEDIRVGASFAYYHQEKESWTRVTINNKISSDFVAIFLVDFGEIITTDTTVLHYLKSDFKKLPAVAIKCRLHGICPTFVDWSPDDMIRFKQLCPENKPFKCEILEYTPDLIGDRECSIRLLDTTDSTRDINIADELVKEGKAKTKE